MMTSSSSTNSKPRITWISATALALGGANLGTMFMISGGLFAGGGTAMIPVFISGVLIAWMAAPGWIKLLLRYPNKVGGLSTASAEAMRPYSMPLGTIVGIGYWIGWAITPSFAATYFMVALKQSYIPDLPLHEAAGTMIVLMTLISLLGLQIVSRIAVILAICALIVTFLTISVPIFFGTINWTQAFTFEMKIPFPGWFGVLTSVMAGLYLIGWVAPIFELSSCFVGYMDDKRKNVTRALIASALINGVSFIILPIIWLGVMGPEALNSHLTIAELSKVFNGLNAQLALLLTVAFFVLNSLSTSLAPISSSSLTLAQLADDGFIPRIFSKRLKNDVPWVATLLTGIVALSNVVMGDPIWLVAAANFDYIIFLAVASIAVYIISTVDYKTTKIGPISDAFAVYIGLLAAGIWIITTIFGFQQFGITRVIIGIAFAYAGALFLVARILIDRAQKGLPLIRSSLQMKLTGTMIFVLLFDSIGYLIAVQTVIAHQAGSALIAILEDIFVLVALVTISVGLIIPGMIVTSAVNISKAAKALAEGTLKDFSNAMMALGNGQLERAVANININFIPAYSSDEVGMMSESFNLLQAEIARSANGLQGAREKLMLARQELIEINKGLENRVEERTREITHANEKLQNALNELTMAKDRLVETEKLASLGELVAGFAHEVNTPIGISITAISQLHEDIQNAIIASQNKELAPDKLNKFLLLCEEYENLITINLKRAASLISSFKEISADQVTEAKREFSPKKYFNEIIQSLSPTLKRTKIKVEIVCPEDLVIVSYPGVFFQIITIFVMNSLAHAFKPGEEGKIIISMRQDNKKSILTYSDNGQGIAPENLKKIFEPFFTTRRGSGNIGLGLHIAYNRVIQFLNGTMEVKSTLGEGTSFIITF